MLTIYAHYDGSVLVPESEVDLPINQSLQFQLVESVASTGKTTDLLSESERENRKAGLQRFLARSIHVADIPLEALRREHMYEDRL